VGALMAVNAVGDVIDDDGSILAGVRAPDGGFVGMMNALRSVAHQEDMRAGAGENTVIGVVATNATLSKAQATKVASMAQNGIARTIRPSHTLFDGDTIFALASGEKTSNTTVIGSFAAEAVAVAIRNAIKHATALDGVQAWQDMQ
jgi:L-aminopeptidase/D-esterase-like protein